MNFSAWSIKNPVPAVLLFVLLTLGGLYSFKAMKVQNFPDMDLPTVTVTAALPGAAPAQMEGEVARKLENALAPLQGLKNLYTKVQDGTVAITAEFRLEKPVQEAVDDVRSAIQGVRADLPADLRDPIVSKLNVSGSPMLAYTIRSAQLDDEALSWFVDYTVARKLLGVRGVGSVARVGGVTRQVEVALDPLRLQALGTTAADISRQLQQVQTESTGGRADLGQGEQPLRLLATVQNVDELARLELMLSNGQRIRLSDVAQVRDTVAEPRALALLNGQPVVGFEVARSKGASEVEVGAAVQAALAELKAQRPDLEITEAFNFVQPVAEEFSASMHLLYEGALLAVIVVWLFLRDGRATLVSAVALPLSVIPTFIGMAWLGFSLNVVTLLALSLVIGVLVDDAIVEVENIERHIRMGKTAYQAAMEAADEIGLAVIATTFTLVAVFLPTAFMSGIAGQFFKQFGWTAALAVLASLLVARLLTPMMAAYLMRPLKRAHRDPFWMPAYLRASRWTLNHRWITLGLAGAFFVGSVLLIPLLPQGFVPPDDNSQTQVFIELPPGATLAQTRDAAEAARLRVAAVPQVRSIYTTIGGGAAGSDPFAMSSAAEVRKATLTVLLAPRGERPVKQGIENDIRAAMSSQPGLRSKVGLGGSGEKYQLVLTGEDPQALSAAATAVEQDLRTLPGLGSIISSASLVRNEVTITPDFARAADLGVTSRAIADTLRVATVGDYDQALAKLNLAQRQVPIVVKLQGDVRQDWSLLSRLEVPGSKGPVLLGQVARIEQGGGPAQIDRLNRVRNVTIVVELSGLPLGDVTAAVAQLPAIQHLPPGVRQVELGDAEMMGELFASFGLAMLTGVLCIYVVLVLLFKDFLQPVTILAALPLALGGAFVALLLAGKSFSMSSLIGLIMLMGIATKNSILLVEYAIEARRGHLGPDGQPTTAPLSRIEALIDAGHKRARPVVMTTLAMGAGMVPLALGWGAADPSFRSPMAVTVIGGLITSTVLSLLVVPVVYTLMDDLEHAIGRFKRWVQSRGNGQPTAHVSKPNASQESA